MGCARPANLICKQQLVIKRLFRSKRRLSHTNLIMFFSNTYWTQFYSANGAYLSGHDSRTVSPMCETVLFSIFLEHWSKVLGLLTVLNFSPYSQTPEPGSSFKLMYCVFFLLFSDSLSESPCPLVEDSFRIFSPGAAHRGVICGKACVRGTTPLYHRSHWLSCPLLM